jgi:hypothetical protein
MRVALSDLDSGGEELVCVHIAHFEWEARRVAACLDACGAEYAVEPACDGHGTEYLVGRSRSQPALRALEYAELRPTPNDTSRARC